MSSNNHNALSSSRLMGHGSAGASLSYGRLHSNTRRGADPPTSSSSSSRADPLPVRQQHHHSAHHQGSSSDERLYARREPASSGRVTVDPPSFAASAPSTSSTSSSIQLNARQVALQERLRKNKQQQPSVAAATEPLQSPPRNGGQQPFVTRSNVLQRTPTRTPNPVSRADTSSYHSLSSYNSNNFARALMATAATKSNDPSAAAAKSQPRSGGGGMAAASESLLRKKERSQQPPAPGDANKALLRKVLAKTLQQQQHCTTGSLKSSSRRQEESKHATLRGDGGGGLSNDNPQAAVLRDLMKKRHGKEKSPNAAVVASTSSLVPLPAASKEVAPSTNTTSVAADRNDGSNKGEKDDKGRMDRTVPPTKGLSKSSDLSTTARTIAANGSSTTIAEKKKKTDSRGSGKDQPADEPPKEKNDYVWNRLRQAKEQEPAALSDKTRKKKPSERQGPASAAATTAYPKPRTMEDEQEDDDGFDQFLQTLQTEVSGQHSQLWESFMDLLQNRERDVESRDGEDEATTTIRAGGHRREKKKKAHKFDRRTKNQLSVMNFYLKNHHDEQCVTTTQLVNDKALEKEKDRGPREPRQQHARQSQLNASRRRRPDEMDDAILQLRSHSSEQGIDEVRLEKTHSTSSSSEQDAILNTRSSMSSTTADTDRDGPNRQPPGSRNTISTLPSLTDVLISTTSTGSTGNQGEFSAVSAKQGVRSHGISRQGGSVTSPSHGDFENNSNPGLEVTLGQFQNKLSDDGGATAGTICRRSIGSASSSTAGSSAPSWTSVQLRTVDEKEADSDRSPTSVPFWAQVKLRRVSGGEKDDESPARESKGIPWAEESTDTSDSSGSRTTNDFLDTNHEPKLSAVASSDQTTSESSTNQSAKMGGATKSKVPNTTQHDKRVRDKIDEAVVFRLKPTSDLNASEETRIIVGKKVLMMVRSEIGESPAQVLWKLPRTDVQSLTLNMATQQVNLLLVEGESHTKVLSFTSSEDCLSFANAFYNMSTATTTSEATPALRSESVPPVVEQLHADKGDETESKLTDDLTDEEHTLLERFRRLRRLKPAEDALHESLSMESSARNPKDSRLSLSAAEDEVAEKYRRMLKVSIPLDAVKHKMKTDHVNEKVYATVVAEAECSAPTGMFVGTDELPSSPLSTMSTSVALSAAEMEVAEVYKKMLRLSVPQDAVRHRMVKDNVNPKIVSIVLGDHSITADGPEVNSNDSLVLSAEEEKLAKQYRTMLKMGVPADAVRHKMEQDEVDKKIVSIVLGDSGNQDSASLDTHSESVAKDGGKVSSKASASQLTADEESAASHYRKMLKLQVPKGQVLQRMQQEGINSRIIDAVVGNVRPHDLDPSDKPKNPGQSKLVSLHWTPLSGKELDNSVWRASKKRNAAFAQPERSDISKLVELFQKKTNSNKSVLDKKSDDSVGSSRKAKLLDITRSNNVAISLKAFKDFSYQELRDIIASLDPMRKIRGERVQFLRDLLPTVTEVKIIKAYAGSADRLAPAERWFRQIVDIKRIETKVDVMRTMNMFHSECEALQANFRLLHRVCQGVMKSEKLYDLLEMVLRIGNVMNEGTRTGGAAGFKFDSLLRLTQTKSSDGKTTVLDFLVTVFVARGQREALSLSSDFPDCQTASRMLVSDLVSEAKQLGDSLQQCKDEIQALRNDCSGRSSLKRTTKKDSSSDSAASDSRVLLMASLLSKAEAKNENPEVKSETSIPLTSQRRDFLSAIKDRKSDIASTSQSTEENGSLEVQSGSVAAKITQVEMSSNTSGIARLEEFIGTADVLFSQLESDRQAMLASCKDLSQYCGESGGVGSTSIILGILAEFASNIDSALTKYDQNREAESRRRRKDDAVSSPSDRSSRSTQLPGMNTEGKSLVLMVNDMLKDANDRTKEDFKKGRVYPEASETLKAIYDKEKLSSNRVSTGRSLISSIREQEEAIRLNPRESTELAKMMSLDQTPSTSEHEHAPDRSDGDDEITKSIERRTSSSPNTTLDAEPTTTEQAGHQQHDSVTENDQSSRKPPTDERFDVEASQRRLLKTRLSSSKTLPHAVDHGRLSVPIGTDTPERRRASVASVVQGLEERSGPAAGPMLASNNSGSATFKTESFARQSLESPIPVTALRNDPVTVNEAQPDLSEERPPIPLEAKGTLVEAALLGTSSSSLDKEELKETTVTRMARLRRQEKNSNTESSRNTSFATVRPDPTTSQIGPSPALAAVLGNRNTHRMALGLALGGATTAAPISSLQDSTAPSNDQEFTSAESTVARLARLKREEKKTKDLPV